MNQSYEPLTICNVKKAIILLLMGKAELVAKNSARQIRTVSKSYPWPSVIKLKDYIRVPYKKIILTRKNILKRDGHRCAYCGRGDLPLTVDHVIPKSRGGTDTWENLVAACLPCNNRKGDRTPEEAGLKLRIKPYTPNHILFIKSAAGRIDNAWKPFLFD
ncbi:HNH endonuclease [Melioribacter sp. OK-1-Me]|uniref:HNH endonuclease n=2 Tax=unclassified Melioribacter TaxID=2627329 RepID=UPI004043F480